MRRIAYRLVLTHAVPVVVSTDRKERPVQTSSSCFHRPSARAVLILYLSLSACTSWRLNEVTPQAALQTQPAPKSMRVTLTDSSSIVINNPTMQGDTIVGVDQTNAAVRVPLDSVLGTETRHGDAGKSVLAVLGVAAAAFAVLAVVFVISCNQSGCYDDLKPSAVKP